MENAMQIRNFKNTSHTTQNFEGKKRTTNVRIMRLTCIILQNSKYNEERVLPLKKTETENYLNILFLIKSRKKTTRKKGGWHNRRHISAERMNAHLKVMKT